MASSFQGWGTSWAQTWERISNPNAMYGSVTIRVTAAGTLETANTGFISGSASMSFSADGALTSIGTQQAGSGGVFRKSKRQQSRDAKQSSTQHVDRLHQDDQQVTELLVALVTKGFFYEYH